MMLIINLKQINAKMGIKEICELIQTTINSYTRKPFTAIPSLITLCSLAQRPGLSVITSASNIIKSQSCFGAPTGDLPDGSPNMMNAFITETVREIFRALHEDGVIQSSLGPGDIVVTSTGGNAGGPVTTVGTLATISNVIRGLIR